MTDAARPQLLRLFSAERLARRAAQGDQRAFAEIYRRYHQDLYRFCLATTGDPQDAQEALQNTMVKVLRALPGEERRIQLKPWLYRIARNEAVETIRRRRESAELQSEQEPAPLEIAATAEARERLRGILADLEELPERQRAALLMREMAGLDFEQIGESLETSAQAARQTVYEARLGLRQMEAGREMDCEAVMRELSDGDGRSARRRELRAHLRACESCREFGEGIAERRGGFAAIAPLPLAVSAGLFQGALGAAGAGAAAATSALAKSAATAAVVAVVGIAAVDRGGLIDTPFPGGGDSAGPAKQGSRPAERPLQGRDAGVAGAPLEPAQARPGFRGAKLRHADSGKRGNGSPSRAPGGAPTDSPASTTAPAAALTGSGEGAPRGHGRHRGRPDSLPAASQHGQETAAAHKAPQAQTSPGPEPEGGKGQGPKGSPKPATAPAAKEPPQPHQSDQSQGGPAVGGPAAPPAGGRRASGSSSREPISSLP